MRYLLVVVFFLGIVACNKKPDYSDSPTIKYSEDKTVFFRKIKSPIVDENDFIDSIVYAFEFTDGDGDLGLDDEDRKDTNNINFYADEYRRVGGVWETSLDGNLEPIVFREQFQLLSPKNVTGPIDGILYNVKLYPFPEHLPNDTLKYIIKIKDRAGNFSNTIETPPIILNKQ